MVGGYGLQGCLIDTEQISKQDGACAGYEGAIEFPQSFSRGVAP